MFDKLVIFGVGLIGGSAALALRKAGTVADIVGIDRDAGALDEALRLGVIDAAASDLPSAVAGADLVLLAVPVAQMERIMAAIAPYLAPHTVVTDAGSTKSDVAATARASLGEHFSRFVPGHPIAGTEKSGVSAAHAGLFQGCNTILAPLPETSPQALEKVRMLWQSCGAKVSVMTPQAHDDIFAAVSHLPHILAFALVDEIARRPNAEQLFGFAASGFRDFTRIAGSSPEMWRDICHANRAALLTELDAYQAELTLLRDLIERRDGAALEVLFQDASRARNAWIKNFEKQNP
jgi:prephenate dehydrogenase